MTQIQQNISIIGYSDILSLCFVDVNTGITDKVHKQGAAVFSVKAGFSHFVTI